MLITSIEKITKEEKMTTAAIQKPARGLEVALWSAQVVLALIFTVTGTMKLFTPLDQLALKMPFVASAPGALVRFIGLSELAGAVGLLFPGLLRFQKWLTPMAAVGLLTVMVLAAGFHLSRLEFHAIGVNLVLAALAAFVAWGRVRD
jgi:hypothetical protein